MVQRLSRPRDLAPILPTEPRTGSLSRSRGCIQDRPCASSELGSTAALAKFRALGDLNPCRRW
jgi:hypothetical protein